MSAHSKAIEAVLRDTGWFHSQVAYKLSADEQTAVGFGAYAAELEKLSSIPPGTLRGSAKRAAERLGCKRYRVSLEEPKAGGHKSLHFWAMVDPNTSRGRASVAGRQIREMLRIRMYHGRQPPERQGLEQLAPTEITVIELQERARVAQRLAEGVKTVRHKPVWGTQLFAKYPNDRKWTSSVTRRYLRSMLEQCCLALSMMSTEDLKLLIRVICGHDLEVSDLVRAHFSRRPLFTAMFVCCVGPIPSYLSAARFYDRMTGKSLDIHAFRGAEWVVNRARSLLTLTATSSSSARETPEEAPPKPEAQAKPEGSSSPALGLSKSALPKHSELPYKEVFQRFKAELEAMGFKGKLVLEIGGSDAEST